ncbi:hypothetical protein HBO19_21335 [Pseudomonas sp. WS 5021]|uniref:hypothetical protein n=1 Tax=Pseudomonas sp. WS 5021 TaxID=2717490 RepID=UPI001472B56E|nr:hypothetical protein [Pseudomonas sp. WS 5021]NMY28518.1 hypothetical protein [Pseudomonas sp. WS 5021]
MRRICQGNAAGAAGLMHIRDIIQQHIAQCDKKAGKGITSELAASSKAIPLRESSFRMLELVCCCENNIWVEVDTANQKIFFIDEQIFQITLGFFS